jgi:hypothetical protein
MIQLIPAFVRQVYDDLIVGVNKMNAAGRFLSLPLISGSAV